MPNSVWNGTLGGIFGRGLDQSSTGQASGQQQQTQPGLGQAYVSSHGAGTQVDQASRTVTINSYERQAQELMNRAYQAAFTEQIDTQIWGRPQDHFEAEEVITYLNRMDCRIFPEIHLTDDKFKKLQARLNIVGPPEIPITFNSGYGPIIIRNASYVLNLDKFMEDAPDKEAVPNE